MPSEQAGIHWARVTFFLRISAHVCACKSELMTQECCYHVYRTRAVVPCRSKQCCASVMLPLEHACASNADAAALKLSPWLVQNKVTTRSTQAAETATKADFPGEGICLPALHTRALTHTSTQYKLALDCWRWGRCPAVCKAKFQSPELTCMCTTLMVCTPDMTGLSPRPLSVNM